MECKMAKIFETLRAGKWYILLATILLLRGSFSYPQTLSINVLTKSDCLHDANIRYVYVKNAIKTLLTATSITCYAFKNK